MSDGPSRRSAEDERGVTEGGTRESGTSVTTERFSRVEVSRGVRERDLRGMKEDWDRNLQVRVWYELTGFGGEGDSWVEESSGLYFRGGLDQ